MGLKELLFGAIVSIFVFILGVKIGIVIERAAEPVVIEGTVCPIPHAAMPASTDDDPN